MILRNKVTCTITKVTILRSRVPEFNALNIKLQVQQTLGVEKKCLKPGFILKGASILGLCSTRQLTLNPASFLKTGGWHHQCPCQPVIGILRARWIEACPRTSVVCAEDKRACAARFEGLSDSFRWNVLWNACDKIVLIAASNVTR